MSGLDSIRIVVSFVSIRIVVAHTLYTSSFENSSPEPPVGFKAKYSTTLILNLLFLQTLSILFDQQPVLDLTILKSEGFWYLFIAVSKVVIPPALA